MELSVLKGIGKARLAVLQAAGITTMKELLMVLPIDYRDTTTQQDVASLRAGQHACIEVLVDSVPRLQYVKKLSIVRIKVSDQTGSILLVWFNQPWMAKQIKKNDTLLLYGKVQQYRGALCILNAEKITEKAILPRYPAIANFPQKTFAGLMHQAADEIDILFDESLPEKIRTEYNLCGKKEAIREAHFPTSAHRLATAQRRIGFENLLLYQIAVRMLSEERKTGIKVAIPNEMQSAFLRALPFTLTEAQTEVLRDIEHDLASGQAMNRLVQGDVGSGKTVVAFAAANYIVKAGMQCALMAPTEVLARQHLLSAERILAPLGIRCGLLMGGMRSKERKEALAAIASGEWQLIIGTHALISESVQYQNLGLVITDEQHRFGVRQRKLLSDKGTSDASPHVLVMSATPIPRTLALILYGDLDVSVINALPPGRTPVQTRIVPEGKRNELYQYMVAAVKRGEQTYYVCPLVEESEATEAKSAMDMYRDLSSGALKGLRLGLTYGAQPQEEKEKTLRLFSQGEIDILVATTVIEVGIDVPNATIMVIENADRFGLSQLHQLRGRVGRGKKESWCFLLGEANERLKTLCETNDGFIIAQKDLDLRGPGEFLGTRQHGRIAPESYGVHDLLLIEETKNCAQRLMTDPILGKERGALQREALVRYQKALQNAAMN